MPSNWEAIAQKAQSERDAKIPAEWKIPKEEIDAAGDFGGLKLIESKLSPRELEITSMTAAQALKKLHSGELTSLEATKAMCHRAALAHQITNVLTEIFFDEAYARAAKLDEAFKANGNKPTGPLHGLPVSIKDDQDHIGKKTTWGLIAWADQVSDFDSAAVQILLKSGAVLFVKTNIPQDLMTWESDNHLWGHCKNISNLKMGAGGSSGGEGLILSCKAAYIGIGSDIGGSIRIPAAVNGVYGLKPSARRLAYKGRGIAQGSPELIAPVNGPLGRSVEDLEIISKVWIEEGTKFDSEAIPMKWQEVTLPTKLKLGYFIDTDLLRVVPAVRRAMNEAIEKLKAAGHELVEFPIDDGMEFFTLAVGIFGAYNDNLIKMLDETGEPLTNGMEWLKGEGKISKTNVGDLWNFWARRQALRAKYLQKFLDAGIDGIICPVTGLPSTPHHLGGTNIQACIYTMMFNVLDYSAGVVPYSRVQLTDTVEPGFTPTAGLEEAMWRTYSPELYQNTPVSLQIVGKRLEEEKVLAMMKVVDAVVNGKK